MPFRMRRGLNFLKATTAFPWISSKRGRGKEGSYPAGCSTTARTKRTAQEPGRSSLLLEMKPVLRRAGDPSPTRRASAGACAARRRTSSCIGVGRRQGEPKRRPKGAGKSEGCIRAVTPGNLWATRTRPSKGGPCGGELQGGTMSDASTSGGMSPQLLEVVERARREPEGRFHALAHRIDVPALERAYHRMRKDAAVGVDGVTKEAYGQDLGRNLQDLHARMKAKRYRHQPIRRVHIPKDGGKTRPIGISAFEDKLVQDAVREVLEAIYEQDFLDCSYGFRPGRSAHDAVRTLDRVVHQGKVNWILEADIVSFFDSLDRNQLEKMLEVRVADGSLLRLIGKCLHVGVLEGVELSTSETGTAQGSVLSPLLGNVYLHYALDHWFQRRVKPRLRGQATLVRYADDCAPRRCGREAVMAT